MTGASFVPVELVRRMSSDLGFHTVTVAYGLTEATAIGTCTRAGDPPEKIATTVGKPLPGVEIRCVDPMGSPLPSKVDGEIVIRGFNVMKGYFDDPEETDKIIDAEGWLHTGDIGQFDEDGYLKVTDRLKDMYVTGGFNCYPSEIENVISAIPGVEQVAVVGVPDLRRGEVGKAFVVRAAGSDVDGASVIALVAGRLANFKVPRTVEFVDHLPLNASGKVLKGELRSRMEKQAAPVEERALGVSGKTNE